MREYIEKQIKELNEVLDKYDKLNNEHGQKYAYRVTALIDEIGVLENVLRNENLADSWDNCYQEDSKEK